MARKQGYQNKAKVPMKEPDVYVYVGKGRGVPGLPHRLTKKQAYLNGVDDILEGAIMNGEYALDVPAPVDKDEISGENEEPHEEVNDG